MSYGGTIGMVSMGLAGASLVAFVFGGTLEAIYLVLLSTVLWHEMDAQDTEEK